jgi:1,4-dihydroxy-2-naphthoyl-CoA hydrolase
MPTAPGDARRCPEKTYDAGKTTTLRMLLTGHRSGAMLCLMPADPDAILALMPFTQHLGLIVDEASPDRVIARLAWAPHLCTTGGIMHGGVLMSLADTAGALVTFLGLPEGATTATITSTSQMFRPVTSGTVRAVAIPLNRGRTTVTAQTSLYDSADRLVAQTTQIQAVRDRRP